MFASFCVPVLLLQLLLEVLFVRIRTAARARSKAESTVCAKSFAEIEFC